MPGLRIAALNREWDARYGRTSGVRAVPMPAAVADGGGDAADGGDGGAAAVAVGAIAGADDDPAADDGGDGAAAEEEGAAAVPGRSRAAGRRERRRRATAAAAAAAAGAADGGGGADGAGARVVSNSHAGNMRESLTRMFGGPAGRYDIDQNSGATFPDGAPNYTTGYHNVRCTDTNTGITYSCDFHTNGQYYTRCAQIS